jgi:predicted nucleic acid-binding Zn ribbon protein
MPHAKGFAHRPRSGSKDLVPIGEVVDGLMAEEAFSQGVPIATLAKQWTEVVGSRLATETAPASFENGVLIVRATNGPWGAQARFLSEQICVNANRALGSEVVRSVRVIVDHRRP